jgi:6-phosphofructokinase
VEVMGRYSGWIALYAAIAGGADAALIPEIPFDLSRVAAHITARDMLGARSSIVVVAEGATPVGGERVVVAPTRPGQTERLGGIAERVSRALEPMTDKESRHVVLGHLQRGGSPLAYDRVLATRFGSHAVGLVQRRQFGVMVALRGDRIVEVPLERVVGRARPIPLDSDMMLVARNMGMCLGD